MPQYRLAATAEAERLDAEAEVSAAVGPAQHPARVELRPRRRPLRGRALLRRDEHQARDARLRAFTLAVGCVVFLGTCAVAGHTAGQRLGLGSSQGYIAGAGTTGSSSLGPLPRRGHRNDGSSGKGESEPPRRLRLCATRPDREVDGAWSVLCMTATSGARPSVSETKRKWYSDVVANWSRARSTVVTASSRSSADHSPVACQME